MRASRTQAVHNAAEQLGDGSCAWDVGSGDCSWRAESCVRAVGQWERTAYGEGVVHAARWGGVFH